VVASYYCGRVRGETAGEFRLSEVSTTLVVIPEGSECPFIIDVDASAPKGVETDSESSSGMGAQYVFKTCFSAGRRIGFDRKKSMPES
jgi:hypothetical protein